MNSRIIVTLQLVVSLVLICYAASASEISAKERAQDTRLETPVTLHERRIYLGELFAKLRAQTGLELTINETLPLSGVQVSLHCNRLPVVTLLNSLWSLLSNREAEWTWLRLSEGGKFRYEFTQTAQAREKAARFGGYAQRVFEQYVAVMEDFARMTPKERQRNLPRLARTLYQNIDPALEDYVGEERVWKGVRLFTDAVPLNLRLRLLRGEQEVQIPLSDLSQSVQNLFKEVYAGYQFSYKVNGKEVPLEEPKTLRIYSSSQENLHRQIVPQIMIDYGQAGSVSCLSGYNLERGVQDYIRQLWNLPGDAQDHPAAQKIVPLEAQVDPATIVKYPFVLPNLTGRPRRIPIPHALDTWLLLLARSAEIPMVEILPFQQNHDPGSPVNKTVDEFLSKASQYDPNPMHKWRDGVLLVNYPMWFLEEENVVPYRLVKELTKWRGKIIPLPVLAKLMTALTEAQAQSLAEEYPPVGGALALFPMFGFAAQSPQILSPEGMALTPEKAAILLTLPLPHLESLRDGSAAALRLIEEEIPTGGTGRTVGIRAEASVGGKWVLLGGFLQSTP